jgi:hypothetical protein
MTGTLLWILAHSKARERISEDLFGTLPVPTNMFKFSKGQFSLTNALVSRLPVIFVYHVSHPPTRNFEPCKVKGFLQFSQVNESEKMIRYHNFSFSKSSEFPHPDSALSRTENCSFSSVFSSSVSAFTAMANL